MNAIKNTKLIIENYKMNKIKIENWDILEKFDKKFNRRLYEDIKKRINYVDEVISAINKNDFIFFDDVFIKNKSNEDLFISESTYYAKVRKLAKKFINYFYAGNI